MMIGYMKWAARPRSAPKKSHVVRPKILVSSQAHALVCLSQSSTRVLTRACVQLSKIIAEARWTPARKFRASLSYRVAIARKCLSLLKKRSIRFRSQ